MFTRVWHALLKRFYRKLVLKVIVLDINSRNHYLKLEPFCTLEVETVQGTFVFNFKEDRRSRRRGKLFKHSITNYLVELIPPKDIVVEDVAITNKIVLVVKVLLFKINYKVLVGVLTDIYLDANLEILGA